MTYTALAIGGAILALVLDIFILKTRLVAHAVFWTAYSIILPFQLITNWWLTSRSIVIYSPSTIMDLRIASAPVEDLLFGFALILSVLALWIFQERRAE